MADILERITAVKSREVEAAKRERPPGVVREAARIVPAARDFTGVLRAKVAAGKPAVIAEVKKASPSKGVLREDFDPAAIARSYAAHGAACLSVLTDSEFFQGRPEYLSLARDAAGIPALRKDFIIDEYQVHESRALGADCILLIVASLDMARLRHFESLAFDYGMSVLVEVHERAELEMALQLRTPLIGINNRDLRTFSTRLETTFELLPLVPPDRLVVTESGIRVPENVALMRQKGVHAFLVGEAFMRAADPGQALEVLFSSN